ncbi:microneme protein, putative [Eimeria brunetti]|uniref:Microneme protein, putative n=1 Tax=Eimeria brunetti TaxID=51314 RepID=U6LB08_9EIME|nr:microneme protein, putative [Eimeria brunetti]
MKLPSALGIIAYATIQEVADQAAISYRSLQDALDEVCHLEAQSACASGLTKYCSATVYARYDGRINNLNSKEWRCYTADALNFEVSRAGCVDICGKKKMCLGAYNGSSDTYLSRNSNIQNKINTLEPKLCNSPAPTLQEALDRKCADFGKEACDQGLWAYCDATLYARRDRGNASQKGREWRCYTQDALDFSISGEGCVDDCGDLSECLGAVNGSSTTHLSRGSELASVLDQEKERYCGPKTEEDDESEEVDPTKPPSRLQAALDQLCAEEGQNACKQGLSAYCTAEMFARRDIGSSRQKTREWRCYAKLSLDFGMSGEGCVDDCGNLITCAGAVNGSSVTHLSRNTPVEAAIKVQKAKFCESSQETPETSGEEDSAAVPEATPEPSEPLSRLQASLDQLCAEEGKIACKSGLADFCDASMFARHDVGNTDQMTKEWRCYAKDALNFGISGDGCVDDCGNLIACIGAVSGNSITHLSRGEKIEGFIQAEKAEGCTQEGSQESNDSSAPEGSEERPGSDVANSVKVPPKVPGAGHLQQILDTRCMATIVQLCVADDRMCQYGVARKVGSTWKCYPYGALDDSQSSDACVEDCGSAIPCPGTPKAGETNHIEVPDLNALVEELTEATCKMSKKAHVTQE